MSCRFRSVVAKSVFCVFHPCRRLLGFFPTSMMWNLTFYNPHSQIRSFENPNAPWQVVRRSSMKESKAVPACLWYRWSRCSHYTHTQNSTTHYFTQYTPLLLQLLLQASHAFVLRVARLTILVLWDNSPQLLCCIGALGRAPLLLIVLLRVYLPFPVPADVGRCSRKNIIIDSKPIVGGKKGNGWRYFGQ